VRERYGIDPSQVADFIALRGDSSDKIPGAKGIGPGRAATILREYETLDGAIQAGVFQEQAEALRTYLRIARLQFEAPVPDLPDAEPAWERASELAARWGLNALAKRLAERG
jgi:DNA polymerase I